MTSSATTTGDAPFWRGAGLGVGLCGVALAVLIAYQAMPPISAPQDPPRREVVGAEEWVAPKEAPPSDVNNAAPSSTPVQPPPASASVDVPTPSLAESPRARNDRSLLASLPESSPRPPDDFVSAGVSALGEPPQASSADEAPSAVPDEAPIEEGRPDIASPTVRERYESLSDALLADAAARPAAPATPVLAPSEGWIEIWQPFTSPVSAQGFADRLELLTGFEYRIARRSTDGRHQVSVRQLEGYDPAQMLGQIAERSGLAVVTP